MNVLERIDNGEPRFGTKEHGGITVGDMKVHQQRAARHEPRQRGRHVDGHGGGAYPAFCAHERQRNTAVRCHRTLDPQSVDSGFDVARHQRSGNHFRHASPHRFHQHGGIEPVGDDQHASRWMLSFENRQGRRQMRVAAKIQNKEIRLLCAWLCDRRQLGRAHGRADHAARAQHVFELTIAGTDEKQIDRHEIPPSEPVALP